MHYVKIFVFAVALAMAACDSSAEPGDEPDTATTTDTVSETGKGDSPYSRDTSFSDSDGESIDTTAESDTANTTTPDTGTEPDTTVLPREQVCQSLLPLEGTWYRQDKPDKTLSLSIAPTAVDGECTVTADVRSIWKPYPIDFHGSELPLKVELDDPSSPDGYLTADLVYEEPLLKLHFVDSQINLIYCFTR